MKTQGKSFMKTIKTTLKEYLKDEKQRLAPKTYSGYEDAIYIFEQYLNGYAHQYLSTEDSEYFDKQYREKNKEYCEVFGPEFIGASVMENFLGYFMIRKVVASKDRMKTIGRVMHKLVKWLHEKGYMDDEIFKNTEKDIRRLKSEAPDAEEFSDLLCLYAMTHSPSDYSEDLDDFFRIAKIEPGKLWFENLYDSKIQIGPVSLPPEITSKARTGWSLSLLLGKTKKGWQVLESGSAYP